MKSFIQKALLCFAAFACLTAAKVHADDQSATLKVIGVVGQANAVALSQSVIVAEIDVDTVGTSGTDTYLLGSTQVGYYVASGTSYVLRITGQYTNSSSNFFLKSNQDPNQEYLLYVTKDRESDGTSLSTVTEVLDSQALRHSSGNLIEDEFMNLVFYVKDSSDNPATTDKNGIYVNTFTIDWRTS